MGQILPFIVPTSAPGGFSPEERARLAELAERFAAAGVRVEVIYGATEQGDPWCVVKDEAEEVLIHVARIGDLFVVHYALDDALRQGQDLRSVLNERLAWEDRPEVVVPFSRQAQSLLALIVAATFLHETARPDDDAPRAAFEPLDEASGLAAVAAEPAIPAEAALAGKALHAQAAGLLGLGAAGLEPARAAEWRSISDDALAAPTDHAAAASARVAPGGPAAPIVNLEVVAPRPFDGSAPVVKGFETHPRFAFTAAQEPQATSTTASFTSATFHRSGGDDPPPPQAPPTPTPSVAWIEVDADGDGRPDTRVPVAEEPKPEKPEPAVDHTAILAVGHGFPHAELL